LARAASPTAILAPEIPSQAEAVLAKETKESIAPRIGKNPSLDPRAMNFTSESAIEIPATEACQALIWCNDARLN
jgi:hypothetical protein